MANADAAVGGLLMLSGILIGMAISRIEAPTCSCQCSGKDDKPSPEMEFNVPCFEAGDDPVKMPPRIL